jgi:hypothetical protein
MKMKLMFLITLVFVMLFLIGFASAQWNPNLITNSLNDNKCEVDQSNCLRNCERTNDEYGIRGSVSGYGTCNIEESQCNQNNCLRNCERTNSEESVGECNGSCNRLRENNYYGGHGPGDGSGNKGNGPRDGTGYGSKNCQS